MLKKILIITVLNIGLVIPYSCNQQPRPVILESLSLSVGITTGGIGETLRFVIQEDSLRYNANNFGIKLSIVSTARIGYQPLNYSCTSCAYADDPGDIINSNIDLISVKATNSIKSTRREYEVGDELNELFVFAFSHISGTTHNDFIFNNRGWKPEDEITLKFNSEIDEIFSTAFLINVIIQNGQSFSLTTDLVTLL